MAPAGKAGPSPSSVSNYKKSINKINKQLKKSGKSIDYMLKACYYTHNN